VTVENHYYDKIKIGSKIKFKKQQKERVKFNQINQVRFTICKFYLNQVEI